MDGSKIKNKGATSASGERRSRSLFSPGGAQMLPLKKDFLPPPLLPLFFCFAYFHLALNSNGLFSPVILRLDRSSTSVSVHSSKITYLLCLRPLLKIFVSERLQNMFVNSINKHPPLSPAPTLPAEREKPLFRCEDVNNQITLFTVAISSYFDG